jgi:hypothetical protein
VSDPVPDPDRSDRGKLTPFKSEKSDPDPSPHRSKKTDHTAKILYENTKHIFLEMERRGHSPNFYIRVSV